MHMEEILGLAEDSCEHWGATHAISKTDDLYTSHMQAQNGSDKHVRTQRPVCARVSMHIHARAQARRRDSIQKRTHTRAPSCLCFVLLIHARAHIHPLLCVV